MKRLLLTLLVCALIGTGCGSGTGYEGLKTSVRIVPEELTDFGYLTLDGSCDFNIVIRTALHKNGKYHLGVGGGITAESDLEFEYEETLQKAKAILDALQ